MPSTRLAPAAPPTTLNPIGWVGANCIAAAAYVLRVTTMIGYGVHRLTFGLGRMRPVTREVWVRQILFTAVEALPFTSLIATLLGMGVIVQAQLQLMGAGQSALVAKLLVIVIIRELGPLVAALIIIGRSGTAMVVEMGNMRVAGEIDALEAGGISPFEYLVVPRMGGMAVSIFCISLYFVVISLCTGLLAANVLSPHATAPLEFVELLAAQLTTLDVLAFLAKTAPPALAVAAIACYEGLRAGPAITDVPRAATRGTVTAIATLFTWNAVISAATYLS